jgi:hypothetical protein
VGSDAIGKLIYTNVEDPTLEYTARVACPASEGDALFRSAFAWKLAHSFAGPLTKMPGKVDDCWKNYQFDLLLAKSLAKKEEEPQHRGGDAAWIEAR